MSNVPTKHKLLQLLVVSQLEAVQKQEETLRTLPSYSERAESLKSEIAEFQSRAERLSRLIQPMEIGRGIAA